MPVPLYPFCVWRLYHSLMSDTMWHCVSTLATHSHTRTNSYMHTRTYTHAQRLAVLNGVRMSKSGGSTKEHRRRLRMAKKVFLHLLSVMPGDSDIMCECACTRTCECVMHCCLSSIAHPLPSPTYQHFFLTVGPKANSYSSLHKSKRFGEEQRQTQC